MTGPLTYLDLEFDTTAARGAPLGDIASSLVSLHDLLRDLATIAADPSQAEFREIQVVAIEMRSPLTITLSLRAIAPQAVKAFQEICRDIILLPGQPTTPRRKIEAALDLVLQSNGKADGLTAMEHERLYDHIATLQNAAVPLKRVVVTDKS